MRGWGHDRCDCHRVYGPGGGIGEGYLAQNSNLRKMMMEDMPIRKKRSCAGCDFWCGDMTKDTPAKCEWWPYLMHPNDYCYHYEED